MTHETGYCPHCGSDVEWMFVDTGETRVEVRCADCGRFETAAADFEKAQTEILPPIAVDEV